MKFSLLNFFVFLPLQWFDCVCVLVRCCSWAIFLTTGIRAWVHAPQFGHCWTRKRRFESKEVGFKIRIRGCVLLEESFADWGSTSREERGRGQKVDPKGGRRRRVLFALRSDEK